jgi:enterochelin esterase-like enzyme
MTLVNLVEPIVKWSWNLSNHLKIAWSSATHELQFARQTSRTYMHSQLAYKHLIATFLLVGCTPASLVNDPPTTTQCSDNIDNDGDGRIDGADIGCESTLDDDESNTNVVPDEPTFRNINVAGTFNDWNAADPNYALQYDGEHLWSGKILLPAGQVALKFTAENDWAINWGGGQDDIVPPEVGAGTQDGTDIFVESPLAGEYDVTLNEETGDWSLSFAETFVQNLNPVGADFISLLSQLDAATPTEAQTLINNFTAAHANSELPIIHGGDVLFVSLRDTSNLSVAGTFNDWNIDDTQFVTIADNLGYVGRQVGFGQRHAYKLTDGTNWSKDPQAFEIEWDGFNPNTIGDFNSVFYTEGFTPTNGRLRLLPSVHSDSLNNNREVYVFLPPGYDQTTQEYPTLYFHDGNESIVRSQMDQVVRDQILAGNIEPLIAVFIALPSQNDRFGEYTFEVAGSRGDLYKSFVADELVPLIDSQFRTINSASRRGLIGASLGGLISFHIGYDRADVFGLVGGQSSSFFWENNTIINRIQSGPVKALKFYLDAGNPSGNCDGDNCAVTRQMKQILDNKGYQSLHIEQLGATHDWLYWNQRLPIALQFLFPAD